MPGAPTGTSAPYPTVEFLFFVFYKQNSSFSPPLTSFFFSFSSLSFLEVESPVAPHALLVQREELWYHIDAISFIPGIIYTTFL